MARIGAMLDPKVFKAYDVRGIYPEEIDEEGAYAIGRAYVQQFEPRRIAVGRDMRLSSPQMAEAVIRGAADEGAEVLDLGLVGTEMVYFAVGELGARRRDHGHRLAQPEGVHGHEDRARAARCRSAASPGCSTCATRRWRRPT